MKRTVLFVLLVMASFVLFWQSLRTLFHYAQQGYVYDQYQHPLLMPFLVGGLLLFERKTVFRTVQYSPAAGASLLLASAIVGWTGFWLSPSLGAEELLAIQISGLVLFWIGGFVFCYGRRASQAGLFPLLMLFLTIPIPGSILDKPEAVVQYGSTAVCSLLLTLSGTPFLRQGTTFLLPDFSIQVAKQCSGIHSMLALFIVSLLAGHLFLSAIWKKFVLVLSAIPVVCISNGLRVAGLTLLTIYVNPNFLYGNLHHRGGVCFLLVGLVILFGITRLLRQGETPARLKKDLPEPTGSSLSTSAKL